MNMFKVKHPDIWLKVQLTVDWNRTVRSIHNRYRFAQLGWGKFRNLSELMSEAYRLRMAEQEAWEHLDDFGSGHECGPILAKACDKKWNKMLADAGISDKELYDLVSARTSYRWAHFNLGR